MGTLQTNSIKEGFIMATEDKIEEQLHDAIIRLYHFKKIRPQLANAIANRAMNNLAMIMGYDLEFIRALDPDADTSNQPAPARQPEEA